MPSSPPQDGLRKRESLRTEQSFRYRFGYNEESIDQLSQTPLPRKQRSAINFAPLSQKGLDRSPAPKSVVEEEQDEVPSLAPFSQPDRIRPSAPAPVLKEPWGLSEVAPFSQPSHLRPLARKTEAVFPHDKPMGVGRSRRGPRSRSRSPETPMPSSLDQAFSRHRLTLHSRAMAQLDDIEAELTKEVKAPITANQNAVFALDAKRRELVILVKHWRTKSR